MRSITKYVLAQLATVTLFVTLGLTFAVWLTQSLKLIDYIVNRGLPASTFFSFIVLLLPSFMGIVLPIAAFCAILFVYNKLSMDSELNVMRAAGLSQFQLGQAAMLLGLCVTAIVYSIALYFQPVSYRAFKELQDEIRNEYSAVLLREGTFNTISDGITVYVRDRSSGGELLGILVHDKRDREKPVTLMAEKGALVSSETGPRLVMVNGNHQELDDKTGNLDLLYFDSYTVELATLDEGAKSRWREPKERFLHELLSPESDDLNQRFRKLLIAEGHQRLVAPLYTMSFALIGLAFLLAGEFNRRGQVPRVIVAILCIAGLESLSLALQDLAARSLEAIPAMYAAAILPCLISIFVLARNPRRRTNRGAMMEAAAQ